MYMHTHFTLHNPQKGTLAFRIFPFEDANPFEELQRLSYFSIILIKSGQAHLTADFTEYDLSAPSLIAFSPYQPYRLQSEGTLQGWVINFHPEFFASSNTIKRLPAMGFCSTTFIKFLTSIWLHRMWCILKD